MKKLIRYTTDYLIQHDKKELIELIKDFRQDARDFLDTVMELEEIVDVYIPSGGRGVVLPYTWGRHASRRGVTFRDQIP